MKTTLDREQLAFARSDRNALPSCNIVSEKYVLFSKYSKLSENN
jgi:hypothetical protein